MHTVLVIDDESGIRNAVTDILEDERYRVVSAEDGPSGLEALDRGNVDLVILDIWLPRMGGMDVLREIKARKPELEVIIISGHANIDMAVQAVKLGAFDFIEKPLSIDRILTAARNALALGKLKEENRKLKRERLGADTMIATSPAMAPVLKLVEQAAASDARILILGENGTGKELVAREVHRRSERSCKPFVEVNCAAIPDTLIESELFGHEKGAFTDAISQRKGKFEMADGGTLFLDEIADMSLSAQAKVLRAIQELKFERVGSEKSMSVDVRVVAATNKDLQAEIAAGNFREDLYFRLNVIPVTLPPLRERPEDIPLLAAHFLASEGGGRNFAPDALALLSSFRWPGNVRELKNVVERAAVMCPDDPITAAALAPSMPKAFSDPQAAAGQSGAGGQRGPGRVDSGSEPEYGELKLADAKELFERSLIERKLKECGFNISRAAEALGIYPSNLHAKMKKFGIQTEK